MDVINKIKNEVLVWSLLLLGLGLYLGFNYSSPSLLNLTGSTAFMTGVLGLFMCISRGNRKASIPDKYLKNESAASGE